MHPRYQEHIRALSCVLCICVLENWNWTSTVNDDVERKHKDARSLKNAYWETANVRLYICNALAYSDQTWSLSWQPWSEVTSSSTVLPCGQETWKMAIFAYSFWTVWPKIKTLVSLLVFLLCFQRSMPSWMVEWFPNSQWLVFLG